MFSKEILLFKISTLSDLDTIKYIAQHSFLMAMIINWIITLLVFALLATRKKPNYWLAFLVAIFLNLILTIIIGLGFAPAILTFD